MKRIKRSHKLWAAAIAAALFFGYLGVVYIQQAFRMRELSLINSTLEQQLEELRLQRTALESDLEYSQSDAYIERVAREELGYIRPGEIKFMPGEKAEGGAAEPSASPQATPAASPDATQPPSDDPDMTPDPEATQTPESSPTQSAAAPSVEPEPTSEPD